MRKASKAAEKERKKEGKRRKLECVSHLGESHCDKQSTRKRIAKPIWNYDHDQEGLSASPLLYPPCLRMSGSSRSRLAQTHRPHTGFPLLLSSSCFLEAAVQSRQGFPSSSPPRSKEGAAKGPVVAAPGTSQRADELLPLLGRLLHARGVQRAVRCGALGYWLSVRPRASLRKHKGLPGHVALPAVVGISRLVVLSVAVRYFPEPVWTRELEMPLTITIATKHSSLQQKLMSKQKA